MSFWWQTDEVTGEDESYESRAEAEAWLLLNMRDFPTVKEGRIYEGSALLATVPNPYYLLGEALGLYAAHAHDLQSIRKELEAARGL